MALRTWHSVKEGRIEDFTVFTVLTSYTCIQSCWDLLGIALFSLTTCSILISSMTIVVSSFNQVTNEYLKLIVKQIILQPPGWLSFFPCDFRKQCVFLNLLVTECVNNMT